MSTVRDIAKSAGVSPATVSRSLKNSAVVSPGVRDRVLAEARRLGYKGRQPVRTGMVAMLFFNASSGQAFGGYDGIVWGGVTRAAMSLDYRVCVIDPLKRRAGESYRDFAARLGVDGFVVRVDQDTRGACREIAADGVPHVVLADRFEDDPAVSYVCCNSHAASYAAVKHLIDLGHRRVGVGHNTVLDTDHHDRLSGYRRALEDAGLAFDPELVIPAAADIRGGASVVSRLASLTDRPTAIFFADPAMTVGAIRRCLELELRVPEEMSIAGLDDERLREMTYPTYTAVCQDAEQLAYQAGRWICQQLASSSGEPKDGPLRLETQAVLEVNHTTAPPPADPGRVMPSGQRMGMSPG